MTKKIPDDLVPLTQWIKKLRISGPRLRSMCERREFPEIFEVAPNSYRVSNSAAERWAYNRQLVERFKRAPRKSPPS